MSQNRPENQIRAMASSHHHHNTFPSDEHVERPSSASQALRNDPSQEGLDSTFCSFLDLLGELIARREWNTQPQFSEPSTPGGSSFERDGFSQKDSDLPFLRTQGKPSSTSDFPPHSQDDSHGIVIRCHNPISTNLFKENPPHGSD